MIKIAMYKDGTNFFNKLIRIMQKIRTPKYAHFTHVEVAVNGIWYTSSNRQGIRKRVIAGDSGHWEFIEIETTLNQDRLIEDWFNKRMGLGYDWLGIAFSQTIPFGIDNPKKWFCSESVYSALVYAKVLPKAKVAQWYSPARLIKYIKNKLK